MATRRNTKTQARRSAAPQRRGGGLSPSTVFVVGAALGAAVLFGAPKLLKEDGTDGFLRPKPNADAEPVSLATEQRVADGDGVVAESSDAKAAGAEAASAEPTEEGTEFDFYNVLANKEVEMTPEQQAALNQAEARRRSQAEASARKKAEAAALAASVAGEQADAGVVVMPDANAPSAAAALPKPVAVNVPRSAAPAAAPKTTLSAPAAKPSTVESKSTETKSLPKPVAAVTPSVKDRPVKAAATSVAEAPKPKAKAVAAYAKSPDVTAAAKGVAMVMPAASLDPTRTFEKPAAAKTTVAPAAASTSSNSKVLVQAGAFSDKDQAEKVKAKIAMMGLGARVESTTNAGKSVYRVRLGPYAENSSELSAAKRKLSGGGVNAMEVHIN